MKKGHYEFIIEHRIRDYKADIDGVIKTGKLTAEDKERIRQDEVIIQELEKILTGKNLWVLSFV